MTQSPAAPAPLRVIVAEDEALIRLDLVEMLGEEGYDVVGQAGDGEEAVRLAEQLRPDLVMLDVKMPRPGRDLGRRAHRGRAHRARGDAHGVQPARARRARARRRRDGLPGETVHAEDLVPAIELAVAATRDHPLEAEVADLEERVESRRLVDRAKAGLITQGMREADASA